MLSINFINKYMEISNRGPINIPIPDPSDLTMKHFEKLEGSLKREFQEKLSAQDKFTTERATRIDQKIDLFKESVVEQNKASQAAAAKSENAFQKDIDGLKEVSQLDRQTFAAQITTLTDRISRSEAGDRAVKESKTETNVTLGSVANIVVGIVGVFSLIISIVTVVLGFHGLPIK